MSLCRVLNHNDTRLHIFLRRCSNRCLSLEIYLSENHLQFLRNNNFGLQVFHYVAIGIYSNDILGFQVSHNFAMRIHSNNISMHINYVFESIQHDFDF